MLIPFPGLLANVTLENIPKLNSLLYRNELVGTKILGCSFCSKVTTTLTDQVVNLHCEGSATNKNSPSSSLSRHCLIHEFGDLDMPLAVAQLGHVQEHPQELLWTLSSLVELQWNLNRAQVQMELKFSSGTPGNPLVAWQFNFGGHQLTWSNFQGQF